VLCVWKEAGRLGNAPAEPRGIRPTRPEEEESRDGMKLGYKVKSFLFLDKVSISPFLSPYFHPRTIHFTQLSPDLGPVLGFGLS